MSNLSSQEMKSYGSVLTTMSMDNTKLQPCYRSHCTKLCYVTCIACNNEFYVKDMSKLNGSVPKGSRIPLLFGCGHPVCSKCIKTSKFEQCPFCKNDATNVYCNDSQKDLFPLNLHVLGLIASSYHHSLKDNDEDFAFRYKLSTQLSKLGKANQGYCHECVNRADMKCLQCVALYCQGCYAKIHGRALQSHTYISIFKDSPDSSAIISSSCSSTCFEALTFFCNECNVACCSTCILNSHKTHDITPLPEKNETLLTEFEQVYKNIEDTLLRVTNTKKEVKSTLSSNMYEPQNCATVEASITQHFAYLHGILQNIEARLIKQLYHRRDSCKNNLMDLEAQLRSQVEILDVTLKMAANARQVFNKVDIRNSISVLKEMMDLPCYLMYKDTGMQNKVTLTIDDSIVKTIEDHCTIQLPPIPFYSLVREDELPGDYIKSPLPKKLNIKKIFSESLLEPKPIKQDNTSTSIKSEDTKQESISENEVKVVHVVNPSLFFVQKVALKSEFKKLEEDLTKHGKYKQDMSPINIGQGDMCIVKLGMYWKKNIWYRARVNTVYTTCNNKTFYNVFCIDYGIEEYKIPPSRILHIPEHLQELPPQAIRCCLHGVKPKNGEWTNTSTKDFMKMTSENNCSIIMSVIKSTPEILYVDLCVTSSMDNNMGPQSIRNIMKYMNHVHLDNKQSTKQKTTYVYIKGELPLRMATSLTISHVESPDKIYVTKPGQWKDNLLKITNELKEYYEKDTSAKTIDSPKKGLPCAVQLEDNTWQRGEIAEVINEDKVKVFCVDWGCTLNLNLDCLRVIPLKYTAFNAQAIRISLKYISPESDGNWKPEAIELLMSTLTNTKCVTVTPHKKIEDGYMGCIFSNNCDISWLLKYKGVVSEFLTNICKNKLSKNSTKPSKNCDSVNESLDQRLKDIKPVEKNEIAKDFEDFNMEVRIRRMITPDCIYVIQTELEESCAKMISAMQEFYKFHRSEWRDEWNEGALCAVYSAKDKSYFRAKILKIKSSEEVLVYFCDLGIEETVTLKDIQILHQTFTQEVMYCFKVKLVGILPCGGTSSWPSLSCTTLSDILRKNAFCKFYITKPIQEEAYNDVIPVELWVRQTKAPGPFEPSITEINSINRMLIDDGVALPIKNYFVKMRLTLAAEFKQQVEESRQFSMIKEEEVKWFTNFCTDQNETNCTTKVSNWLSPTEITEEVFHAIPTYVDNNCVIYLHPKKNNADVLKYIESKLQTHFKSVNKKEREKERENKEKRWKEGDLCIAKYHLDNKWYRGRIVKNLGRTLQVEFIDYGNVEECEIEYVSDNVKLTHLPIQCTKCVISGLKPAAPNGKWILDDLDRIHALLVGQECKVSVLQRQSTHLIVSIIILRPWKGDLLLYLANHMDMNIDIDKKLWNYSESTESEDLELNSTDVIIEEIIRNYKEACVTDTSRKVSSETYTQDATLNENMISGNLMNPSKSFESESDDNIDIFDFESISCIDIVTLNKALASSTPEGSIFGDISPYKQLIIPQETKYIELTLSFNLTPTTSFALLAENNDAIFPTLFREYYLKYIAMMSNIQVHANCQPLIKSFEKNTPCIAKFSDNTYYRGIIRRSEKTLDAQYIKVLLAYVDYGNDEYITVDLSKENHNLRVLKEEWLKVPAIAIQCTHFGLNFVSEDNELLASKLNEIYYKAVVARIKEINDGNSLVAEVYKDKTCTELCYADLIKQGFYQFKEITD